MRLVWESHHRRLYDPTESPLSDLDLTTWTQVMLRRGHASATSEGFLVANSKGGWEMPRDAGSWICTRPGASASDSNFVWLGGRISRSVQEQHTESST